jgi:hypothetical protein
MYEALLMESPAFLFTLCCFLHFSYVFYWLIFCRLYLSPMFSFLLSSDLKKAVQKDSLGKRNLYKVISKKNVQLC